MKTGYQNNMGTQIKKVCVYTQNMRTGYPNKKCVYKTGYPNKKVCTKMYVLRLSYNFDSPIKMYVLRLSYTDVGVRNFVKELSRGAKICPHVTIHVALRVMPANVEVKTRLADRGRAVAVAKELSGNEGMKHRLLWRNACYRP